MLPKNLISMIGCLIILGLTLTASSCHNSTDAEDDQGSPLQNQNYKYLTFKVTCGPSSTPGIFDVAIFDQSTQKRLLLGGTGPDGRFITLNKMDASKKYRAEIYSLPNQDCALAFWDISLATTPGLWTDNPNAQPAQAAHVGSCSPAPSQGCWGP